MIDIFETQMNRALNCYVIGCYYSDKDQQQRRSSVTSCDDEPVWSRKPTIPHGGYMFPLTRRCIKCYNCVLLLFCKGHNDLVEQPSPALHTVITLIRSYIIQSQRVDRFERIICCLLFGSMAECQSHSSNIFSLRLQNISFIHFASIPTFDYFYIFIMKRN